MDAFRYFHLCDHRLLRDQRAGKPETITVTSDGDQIHRVINGATILEILEVRVLEYEKTDVIVKDFYYDRTDGQTYDDQDPGEGYYDDEEDFVIDYGQFFAPDATLSEPIPPAFYEPFVNNRIRWLVKPPTKYQMKAIIKYSSQDYQVFQLSECPKCNGRGWFIDILDSNGQFGAVSGVEKIAQRVLKELMTEITTHPFDNEYGQNIMGDMMEYFYDEETLFDMIRSTVSSVEDAYLNEQQNRIDELAADERLASLGVHRILKSPTSKVSLLLELIIQTEASEEEQLYRVGF